LGYDLLICIPPIFVNRYEKNCYFFPGSFDPFTKGHKDIVIRGLQLFDEIIIAIGHNTKKECTAPLNPNV